MTADLTPMLEKLDTLDFAAFQQLRTELLAANPSIVDCSETNLWRPLASLVPKVPQEVHEKVHRCHLAQQWLAQWGLPAAWAPCALVSTGVRHSLSLIFAQMAAHNIPLMLPSDVYPVYAELARAANLPFQTFTTLNGNRPLQLPDEIGWLVLPMPLKPNGRVLSAAEGHALQQWLRADDRRRIIFDAVYTFDKRFDSVIADATDTDQAIVLHSLSKGWLHPKVFGIALVPESERELFTETFRANSPTQLQLAQARYLQKHHPRLPLTIFTELQQRQQRLLQQLPAALQPRLQLPAGSWHAGYLISIEQSASQLLAEHRILAIPATVFGSVRTDCSILSALRVKD
jgi:aspartate/methionine/tyrosine aminotransferase